MQPIHLLLVCLFLGPSIFAAELKTKNVFLITTDGLRWEEVFQGAEKTLLGNNEQAASRFWRDTAQERRELLLPFFWKDIAAQGQLWGNKANGSEVRVSNGRNFSYPGYNELLTGYADPAIDSNDKKLNINTNVFEWLHSQPEFRGRVTAVLNWDVLPWILNAPRSGFPIWSGFETPEGTKLLEMPPVLKELVEPSKTVWGGVLLDTFVGFAAKHAVKAMRPRAMYISYGETDDWAHEGAYERYLKSAHQFDRFIADLWKLVQSMPEYRGTTTFLITTDHGRGPAPTAWKSHGAGTPDSAYMWFAMIGPDTPALGERSNSPAVTQAQVAATVAALLGQDFPAAHPKAAARFPEVIGGLPKPAN